MIMSSVKICVIKFDGCPTSRRISPEDTFIAAKWKNFSKRPITIEHLCTKKLQLSLENEILTYIVYVNTCKLKAKDGLHYSRLSFIFFFWLRKKLSSFWLTLLAEILLWRTWIKISPHVLPDITREEITPRLNKAPTRFR